MSFCVCDCVETLINTVKIIHKFDVVVLHSVFFGRKFDSPFIVISVLSYYALPLRQGQFFCLITFSNLNFVFSTLSNGSKCFCFIILCVLFI